MILIVLPVFKLSCVSLSDLQEFFLNRGALSEIRKQSVSQSVAFILTVLIVFLLNRIS